MIPLLSQPPRSFSLSPHCRCVCHLRSQGRRYARAVNSSLILIRSSVVDYGCVNHLIIELMLEFYFGCVCEIVPYEQLTSVHLVKDWMMNIKWGQIYVIAGSSKIWRAKW